MASHLKVPVRELKHRITFTEFLEWLEFLDKEEARHSKTDHYLAQITAEIRRGYVTDPNKVDSRDFLLRVKTVGSQHPSTSKAIWAAHLKVKLN